MRRCMQTIGSERNINRMPTSGTSDYHLDTICTMDVNFDEELLFTGGRDGSIFLTKLGGSQD